MKAFEAAEIVQMIMAAFPRQAISADTAKVYCEFLADLSIEEAKAAARHHIATSRWFPTIAELRETVTARAVDLPDAEVAWLEVTKAIRNVGRYRAPAFSSPVLAAAVEAIGWQNLCNSDVADLGVNRAHFFRTYAALRTRQQQGETLSGLGLAPAFARRHALPGASGGTSEITPEPADLAAPSFAIAKARLEEMQRELANEDSR